MSLLVSDVQTAFGRRKRDITDVPAATFYEWADFVNKFVYRKLRGTDPERFMQSTTFTVTSDPQTSALPADFRDVQPLGTGFFIRNSDGTDSERTLGRTGFGSTSLGYYITTTNVVFTGLGNSEVIVLRYMPTQTKLTQSTQYFTLDGLTGGVEVIPDEYLEALIEALDVLYSRWDDNVSEESYADTRFVRALDELVNTLRREPDAFAIPDYSNNY